MGKIFSTDFSKGELWNAFKNLFRGIAESVPLVGSSLILFDAVRNTRFVFQIEKEMKDNQEKTLGVAVDGEVIMTCTYDRFFQTFHKLTNDESKAIPQLNAVIDLLFEKQESKTPSVTLLIQKLGKRLKNLNSID